MSTDCAHLFTNEEMRAAMDTLHASSYRVDVRLKTVVACVLKTEGNKTRKQSGLPDRNTQAFGAVGLASKRVVVRTLPWRSTGVYWKPIYNLLEGHFELLVVNAQHTKTVPGRKDGCCGCGVDCRLTASRVATW